MPDSMFMAAMCLALGCALAAAAVLVRRPRPPRCRRCLFPVDVARAEPGRCPECGSDLGMPRAVATRSRPPRSLLAIAGLLILASAGIGLTRAWAMEGRGELDGYKPSWLLAMQLRHASPRRESALASQLVLRARRGMPTRVARGLAEAWLDDRARGTLASRYTPVAEALFPTGIIPPEEIERYTRGLLAFSVEAAGKIGRGQVLPIKTEIRLMDSTRLRFEITRARFMFGPTQLQWQPDPVIHIGDAGSFGSASTISHATTNYVPFVIPEPEEGEIQGELIASYAVDVYFGPTLVSRWTERAERPLVAEAVGG